MTHTNRTLWVDQKHARATDDGPGSARVPFRTIGAAAARAAPGDTVRVLPGLYRERVCPAQGGRRGRPIVYEAAKPGTVIISGADPFDGRWTRVRGARGVFRAALHGVVFPGTNPFAVPLQRRPGQCTGQLFYDGRPLAERPSRAEVLDLPGTWCAEEQGGSLLVHLPDGLTSPDKAAFEITTRSRVFAPLRRGLGYVTVRGFVLERAANNYCGSFWERRGLPQAGLLGCRGGHHWVIEDNVVRQAKTFGLDIGYEGPNDADGLEQPPGENPGCHVVRRNRIVQNGAGGICGCGCPGSRIVDNVIDGNETLGTAFDESAGIKLHFCHDVVIEGNLIRGNDCSGIWLDNGWRGARITRNCIMANAGAGIFMELGDGPALIDRNIVAYTRPTMALAGDGIYSHDASGVTVAHNLLWFNANFGLWSHIGSERPVSFRAVRGGCAESGPAAAYLREHAPDLRVLRRPAEQSRWTVVNNLVLGNSRGAFSLPPVSARSRGTRCDGNLLAGGYDLRTSETFGAPLDRAYLLRNTNKDRQPGEAPLLDLDAWRRATGWDRASAQATVLRPRLGFTEMIAEFVLGPRPSHQRCRRVPEVDRDYHGRPFPPCPAPGPFAGLREAPELSDPLRWATPHRGPYEKLRQPSVVNRFALWPASDGRQGDRT